MVLSDTEALDLLEGLVRIPSLSTQEEQAVAWLVERMADLGFQAERDAAGNAVGVRGAGPHQIVLLGHIDTVPGDIPVRREDGKLYGRGSVDAKGPLATFVAAAARAQLPADWQVVVVGAVEEEAASSKGAHYAATRYQPDMCVIGEPSHWDRVTLGYKGRLLIHYRLRQPMSHTAGKNPGAPEIAVEFWNRLAGWCAAFNQGRPRAFDQALPSLRHIRSDSDGLYDSLTMTIGVRLPLDLAPETLADAVTSWAGEASLTFTGHEAAYRAEKNTPLVRGFVQAIRSLGGTPAFKDKTGTSDMNVVGPRWRCPIVAYGPGDSALDHTPDEHLALDEYLRAVEVLSLVLEALGPS